MILASIKPYYYYLIAEGKKKIEVRKTALKNLPQDIAFYMSKDEKSFAKIPKEFQEKYRKHFGKIGMRVECDKVMFLTPLGLRGFEMREEILKLICLTNDDLNAYGGLKTLYGWHISNLKIYDKPKELSEFERLCNYKGICYSCDRFRPNGTPNYNKTYAFCDRTITRPPQSYMRVKELKEV